MSDVHPPLEVFEYKGTEALLYRLPIRGNFIGSLCLPRNLTLVEALRIYRMLQTVCVDFEP